MKKTSSIITVLALFYLHIYFSISYLVQVILVFILIGFPFWCIPSLKKQNEKQIRKDGIIALTIWGITIIPTGLLTVTILAFGLPPAGYNPLELFS